MRTVGGCDSVPATIDSHEDLMVTIERGRLVSQCRKSTWWPPILEGAACA